MKSLASECVAVNHMWPKNAHKEPVAPAQIAWVTCIHCALPAPVIVAPLRHVKMSATDKKKLRDERIEQFMEEMRQFNRNRPTPSRMVGRLAPSIPVMADAVTTQTR